MTNCGTRELSPKEKEQIEQEIAAASSSTQIASAYQTASIDGAILIKTYFHVIYKDGQDDPTNVSDVYIEKQLEVLNNYYAGRNSIYKDCQGNPKEDGVQTPFVFIKKGKVNRIRNDVWHSAGSIADAVMKRALRTGTCADLNVYIKAPPHPYNPSKKNSYSCSAEPFDTHVFVFQFF